MTDHATYFNYLRSRSLAGYLYRRFWLYPTLARHVSGRVLDVGCGLGDFLRYRRGRSIVGVDLNPLNVEWCRAQGLDARLIDGKHLPFDEAVFDSAVLDNVLEHISDPALLLSELWRVLRPGALLVVGVPGPKGFSADADHKVFYDEDLLASRLRGAGFTPMRTFFTPIRSEWLSSNMRQYCLYGVFARS